MEAKQDKPRICEVLGVEVGERFSFTVNGMAVERAEISKEGVLYDLGADNTINCVPAGRLLCDLINHPESIVRCKRFTPQEVEDAKAIKRILPNMRAVRRNGVGALCIRGNRCEYVSFLANTLFPTISADESYTLDEIIGEEDEDEPTYD